MVPQNVREPFAPPNGHLTLFASGTIAGSRRADETAWRGDPEMNATAFIGADERIRMRSSAGHDTLSGLLSDYGRTFAEEL
jgi:hypothetical protein